MFNTETNEPVHPILPYLIPTVQAK